MLQVGADVNLASDKGTLTPLLAFITSKRTNPNDAVEFTHKAKKQIKADLPDREGRTVLFYAVKAGNIPLIQLLVESCKANVNHMDMQGYTPLTFSILHRQLEAAQCLLHIAGSKINFMIARPRVPASRVRLSSGVLFHLSNDCGHGRALPQRSDSTSWQRPVTCQFLHLSLPLGTHHNNNYNNNNNNNNVVELSLSSLLMISEHEAIPVMTPPIQEHATCATALLSWHLERAGDPQHRRLSANCFGTSATVRPSTQERIAHAILDRTANGDDAIAVLQTLETSDIAAPPLAKPQAALQTVAEQSDGTAHSEVLDIDHLSSNLTRISPTMKRDDLVEQLSEIFATVQGKGRINEKQLMFSSTPVLMLLAEARNNAKQHAYTPSPQVGMNCRCLVETRVFQALQLNPEPSVTVELKRIFVWAENEYHRAINVNAVTASKWRGRNVAMLHVAMFHFNDAAVDFLLTQGADPLLEPNPEGPFPIADITTLWTQRVLKSFEDAPALFVPCALVLALRLGDEAVVSVLVRHGVVASTKSVMAYIPRQHAVQESRWDGLSTARRRESHPLVMGPVPPLGGRKQTQSTPSCHSIEQPSIRLPPHSRSNLSAATPMSVPVTPLPHALDESDDSMSKCRPHRRLTCLHWKMKPQPRRRCESRTQYSAFSGDLEPVASVERRSGASAFFNALRPR